MTVNDFIRCIKYLSDTCPEIGQAQLCDPKTKSPRFNLGLRLGEQVAPWHIVNDWEMHRWFYEATGTPVPPKVDEMWKNRETERIVLARLKESFPNDILYKEDDSLEITPGTTVMDAQNALVGETPEPMVVLRYNFPSQESIKYAERVLDAPIWHIASRIAKEAIGYRMDYSLAQDMVAVLNRELDEFVDLEQPQNKAPIDAIDARKVHFLHITEFMPSRTACVFTMEVIAEE